MAKHVLRKLVTFTAMSTAIGVAVANQILNEKEKKEIHSYGTKVETPYGKMNVEIQGEGKECIVLLSGYGTASPILDFRPFASCLAKNARVITLEYLGYGDSDDTDRERTVENICEEVHLALQALNVNKYYLMPHSISGVYSLAYANYYPEEVEGILAIDMSVPKQIDKADPKLETILSNTLYYTGLGRILMKTKPEMFIANNETYDSTSIEQMKLKALQKASTAIKNEGKLLRENMEKCRDMKWPETLPILLFICKSTIDKTKNWWLDIHEEQLENVETSSIVVLEGMHYLHRDNAEKMAEEVDNFITFTKEMEIFY